MIDFRESSGRGDGAKETWAEKVAKCKQNKFPLATARHQNKSLGECASLTPQPQIEIGADFKGRP